MSTPGINYSKVRPQRKKESSSSSQNLGKANESTKSNSSNSSKKNEKDSPSPYSSGSDKSEGFHSTSSSKKYENKEEDKEQKDAPSPPNNAPGMFSPIKPGIRQYPSGPQNAYATAMPTKSEIKKETFKINPILSNIIDCDVDKIPMNISLKEIPKEILSSNKHDVLKCADAIEISCNSFSYGIYALLGIYLPLILKNENTDPRIYTQLMNYLNNKSVIISKNDICKNYIPDRMKSERLCAILNQFKCDPKTLEGILKEKANIQCLITWIKNILSNYYHKNSNNSPLYAKLAENLSKNVDDYFDSFFSIANALQCNIIYYDPKFTQTPCQSKQGLKLGYPAIIYCKNIENKFTIYLLIHKKIYKSNPGVEMMTHFKLATNTKEFLKTTKMQSAAVGKEKDVKFCEFLLKVAEKLIQKVKEDEKNEFENKKNTIEKNRVSLEEFIYQIMLVIKKQNEKPKEEKKEPEHPNLPRFNFEESRIFSRIFN